MARFMMNEKSNVEAALTFVHALREFHNPSDTLAEDEILAASVRAIEALEDLLAALDAKRAES